MKVEYINAYIAATKQLFDVMFDINQFERNLLSSDAEAQVGHDVSAVIGVTGDCTGAVILSFTKAVAIKMVSQLIGEDITTFNNDACDAIGEMVNIIAGNANRELQKLGRGELKISVPTVFVGKEHSVKIPKDAPYVCIGFQTDLGAFCIHVSLECE